MFLPFKKKCISEIGKDQSVSHAYHQAAYKLTDFPRLLENTVSNTLLITRAQGPSQTVTIHKREFQKDVAIRPEMITIVVIYSCC